NLQGEMRSPRRRALRRGYATVWCPETFIHAQFEKECGVRRPCRAFILRAFIPPVRRPAATENLPMSPANEKIASRQPWPCRGSELQFWFHSNGCPAVVRR